MAAKELLIFAILLAIECVSQTREVPKHSYLAFCSYIDEYPYDTDFLIKTMVCQHMTSEKHLDDDLISSIGSKAQKLVIASSSLRYISHDSFVDTAFKEIYIIDSDLLALTDTDVAFQGLENSLTTLVVVNSSYVLHWDWNHLRNLHSLNEIRVMKSLLLDLTEDITRIPQNVKSLTFYDNAISSIHSEAFANLPNLSMLTIEGNKITTLERSMFPNPADKLEYLHLSSNSINSLPPDMFQNMPKLLILRLDNNQLTTIDERSFGPVIGNLAQLSLHDNPLLCDCRIKWLTRLNLKSMDISGECESPMKLRSKPIVGLRPHDLWC